MTLKWRQAHKGNLQGTGVVEISDRNDNPLLNSKYEEPEQNL